MAADPRLAKQLFDQALERPAHERGPFLDGADAELHAQVDGLLEALAAAGEFLAEPAATHVAGSS